MERRWRGLGAGRRKGSNGPFRLRRGFGGEPEREATRPAARTRTGRVGGERSKRQHEAAMVGPRDFAQKLLALSLFLSLSLCSGSNKVSCLACVVATGPRRAAMPYKSWDVRLPRECAQVDG